MSILFYHILFYTVLFCFYNIFCSIQSILFYLSILFCSALVYSVLFCSFCSSVVHHNCLAGYGYSHALWSVLEQSILFLWSYENCPPLFFLAHMGTNVMWGSFMVSFLFWGWSSNPFQKWEWGPHPILDTMCLYLSLKSRLSCIHGLLVNMERKWYFFYFLLLFLVPEGVLGENSHWTFWGEISHDPLLQSPVYFQEFMPYEFPPRSLSIPPTKPPLGLYHGAPGSCILTEHWTAIMFLLGPSLGAFCSGSFSNTRILAAWLGGLESSERR